MPNWYVENQVLQGDALRRFMVGVEGVQGVFFMHQNIPLPSGFKIKGIISLTKQTSWSVRTCLLMRACYILPRHLQEWWWQTWTWGLGYWDENGCKRGPSMRSGWLQWSAMHNCIVLDGNNNTNRTIRGF